MSNRVKVVLSIFIGAVLTAIDLISKTVVDAFDIRVPNSGYFLGLARIYNSQNYGIAFGLGADNPAAMIAVIVITALLIVGIAAVAFTVFRKNTPVRMTLAVIVAGALGNFIDRACFGYVRDFLDFSGFRPFAWLGSDFNFGICNVADLYITFGAVALLIIIFFIGPHAVFPLTKKWREESKRLEAEKEAKKAGLDKVAADETPSAKDSSVEVEEEVVFRRDDGDEGPQDHGT